MKKILTSLAVSAALAMNINATENKTQNVSLGVSSVLGYFNGSYEIPAPFIYENVTFEVYGAYGSFEISDVEFSLSALDVAANYYYGDAGGNYTGPFVGAGLGYLNFAAENSDAEVSLDTATINLSAGHKIIWDNGFTLINKAGYTLALNDELDTEYKSTAAKSSKSGAPDADASGFNVSVRLGYSW